MPDSAHDSLTWKQTSEAGGIKDGAKSKQAPSSLANSHRHR
ncbi:hypothetical protein RRG08_006889, partial [Elysia crispata]